MSILRAIYAFMRGLLADRARLAAENLALRQQLPLLKRAPPEPASWSASGTIAERVSPPATFKFGRAARAATIPLTGSGWPA
jgi:hypothetical protein